MQSRQTFIVLFILLVTVKSYCEANQDSLNSSSPLTPRSITEDQIKQNEIHTDGDDKDRIQIPIPIKSLVQTTIHLALTQSSLANHLNIDTVMDVINSTAYTMSKVSTLIRVIKVAAIVMGLLLGTSILYPPLLKSLMHDPVHLVHLDKFMSNGMDENSMLGILGKTTDSFLNRIGFRDYSSREKTLCYAGTYLRCSFPASFEAITKFASSNLSNINLREHKYVKAFWKGFVDNRCTNF